MAEDRKTKNPNAFPLSAELIDRISDLGDLEPEGMTLRDYFAAKVMQSIFAGQGARMVADRDQRYDETNWAEVVAKNSYEMADAMLKERES